MSLYVHVFARKIRRQLRIKKSLLINVVPLMAIVILCLYLITAPYLPSLWFAQPTQETTPLTFYASKELAGSIIKETGPRLVIPKINVDSPIVEGNDEKALKRGIWRRPNTSDSPFTSNMVLTGHRFQYLSGPRTFYYLDKLKKGDQIIVYWNNQPIEYEVSKVFTVTAQAVEIENPTDLPLLTLYTCTPLWSSTHRLVVQATPVQALSLE